MTSSCSKRGLGWKCGEISSQKVWLGIGTGCQGGGEITIPEGVKGKFGCGT